MENTISNIRNIQRSISGVTIYYTNGTKEFKTFNDYFYVTNLELIYGPEYPEKHKAIIKDLKKTIENLRIPNIKDIQFCKKGVGEFYTTREVCCLKIIVNDNFKTREIADKIKLIKDVQVFENDVDIEYKYLFAHNINPIQFPEKGLSVLSLDLETRYEKGKELINQEIISCALVYKNGNGEGKKIWIGSGKVQKDDVKVITVNSEVELINKIFYYLENLDYDILTGFNINGFDLPCLVNRAKVNNIQNLPIKVNWEFVNGELINKIGTIIDCYDLIEHKFLGLKTKRPEVKIKAKNLKYIADNFLDENKIDYSFLTPIEQFTEEDYSKLIQYNVQDAWLCVNLLEKYNYLKEIPAICNASKILLKDWQSASRIHDKIISREFYERNYLIPNKRKNEKESYEGGIVLGEQGVYKNIIVLDISGSYPSAILYGNISNDTLVNSEKGIKDTFTTPHCHFVKKEIKEGVVAKLTRNFRIERSKHKNQIQNKGDLHDNMQHAYKILANSLYGVLGYEKFRYYNPNIASSVTYIARNNLINLINIAKEYGEVIYCDTDSVFISTSATGVKDLLELGIRIEKEINNKIKSKGFEIELKYITPKLIVEAQKKYFCHAYLGDKNWYEVKGMESKRSDTIDYASRKIDQLIKKIADDKIIDIDKEIETIKKEIKEIEIEELSKTVKLTKTQKDYKNTPEHLKAVLNSGGNPDQIDIVNYVKCKNGVYLTEYAKEHKLQIDYDYYLNSIILPIINRIKEALNYKGLSDFNLNSFSIPNNKENKNKNKTKSDFIKFYKSKGLNLIPIKYKNKNPIWNNWTEYCLKPAPNFDSTFYNIGVTCGYSSFHAIDFDTPEGYESFKCYLQEIGIDEKEILAHSARRDLSHRTLYFRDIKGRKFIGKKLDTEKYKTKKIDLEVCGVGNQILVPPSVHPNGNQYKFINLGKGKIYEVDLKELIENYYKKHGLEVVLEEYKEIKNYIKEIEFDLNGNNKIFNLLDYEFETNTLLSLIDGAPCESNFLEHRYHSNYALGSIIMQKCNGNIETSFKIWCNIFGNYEDHNEKRTLQYLNYIKRDLDRGKKVGKNGYIKKHGICNCNCRECWIDKFLEDKNINTLKFKIGHNVEIGKPIDISKMPKYDNQRIEMNQGLIFKTIQKIKDPYKEMALIKTMPGSGKTRTVMEFMNGRNDCIYVAPSHELIKKSGFNGIHIYGMRYLCPKIQEEAKRLENKSDRTKTELIIERTGARFYCFKHCNKKGKCDYWDQYKKDFGKDNIGIVYHSLASKELHNILMELLLKKKGKKYLFLDDINAFNLLKEDDIFLKDIENNIQALKDYYVYKVAHSKEFSSFAHEVLMEIFEIYKNVLNGTFDKKEVGQVFARYTNLITGNTKNRYSIMPYYINAIEWNTKRLFEEFGDEIDLKIIPKDLSRFLLKKHHARFKYYINGELYLHYEYSMISQSDTPLDEMYKVILNATAVEKLHKITTKIKKIHTLEDNSTFKNIVASYFTEGKFTRANGALYTNKKLINNIVDLCNRLKGEKILIKAPKDFIPTLKKHIPRDLHVLYSVDFGDYGLNDYEECTCMIKVGDIEPSIDFLKRCFEKEHPKKKWNGEREIITLPYIFKNRIGAGKFLKTNSYKDKDIRQLAKELRYAEMKQAIGRLRSELKDKPIKIFLFSSYPYDFLVPTYCGTYEQFKTHNMLDEVDTKILEVVDQKIAETTEQIHQALRALGIKIGKSSVYNKIANLLESGILQIKDKLARGLRLLKINFNLINNLNNSDSKEINNNNNNNLESESKNLLELFKKWLFYNLNFNVWKQSDIFKKDLRNF